jgi:hypothetical protein
MAGRVASYTFLPWLRQGIASQIDQVDTLGAPSTSTERATLEVGFDVNGRPLSNTVSVIGPGDIVGINPRAVVRTDPRRWITDFEPNYLAFIEFYDEDFPWRYTPARPAPGHRLRPWLVVVVLTEDEYTRAPTQPGPLPVIRLDGAGVDAAQLFPPMEESWAWAHVHVSQDISNGRANSPSQTVDALEDLVAANPDQAVSRLVCPRRLEPLTAYTGFVVPAFETGRQAGLGQAPSGDGQAPSWGAGQVEYPVYYEWSFGTSERGDFEYLVGLLEARPVDDRVGIRDMDVQRPGFGVAGMTDPPVMGLEGALRKPGAVPRPVTWPPAVVPPMVSDLAEVVNRQQDLLDAPPEGTNNPDPIISPPLYGCWHAIIDRLDLAGTGWTHELNRDPRLRVPAGFGAEVIATHQDDYMARAWAQLGDVIPANQRIRQAQLAIAASTRLHRRHLADLDAHELVAATRLVHSRLLAQPTRDAGPATAVGSATGSAPGVTLRASVNASRLTPAAASPAFRRMARPRGRIARALLPASARRPTALLPRLDDGTVTAAPPKEAPPGQIAVDDLTEAILPGWIPGWLIRARWWIVAVLVALAILLAFAALPVAIAVAVLTAALAAVLRWLGSRLALAERMREDSLTAAAVDAVPARPDFVVTTSDTPTGTPDELGGEGVDSPQAARFRSAVSELHTRFDFELPQTPPRAALGIARRRVELLAGLDPRRTVPARLGTFVQIPESLRGRRPTETVVPAMAHPVFADPMYAPLRDLSAELMIPNLDLIPENTISLLETNRDFIEAYMVGLNHEMARELQFNEFPTDLRPTCFRQFWDIADIVNRDPSKTPTQLEEEQRDITPLHTWGRSTPLGSHENRPLPTGEPDEGRLVLVIKGQLLKRYPTAVIFAQRARWGVDDETGRDIRVLEESEPADNVREPLFAASIDPGLRFVGFDLTASEADGSTDPTDNDAGWFFVIQERPGEPRFGLDLPDADTPAVPTEWNDLAWSHVTLGSRGVISLTPAPTTNITEAPDAGVDWGANAADMAYVLHQVPAMIAVHAADMLEGTSP